MDRRKGEAAQAAPSSHAHAATATAGKDEGNAAWSDPEDSDEELLAERPDFYDSGADEEDEEWVHEQRKGRETDAILNCPGCLQTVCSLCQRHAVYKQQYRAVFVQNCEVDTNCRVRLPAGEGGGGAAAPPAGAAPAPPAQGDEVMHPVKCATCHTELGVVDQDEVYHFFHIFPSAS